MNPATAAPLTSTPTAVSLAVTGSKGGVGKSNLVLNLAVTLGRMGRRVLLVDGDLGLANLDVLLGLMPSMTVEQLLQGHVELDDVLLEGPAGIRILPAASGVPDLTKLEEHSRKTLINKLSEGARNADDVLVDTGAGLGEATLALQLAASRILLVTTPEPTSLVDAYATLKVLWCADPSKPVDLVVNAAADDGEADQAYEQIAKAARHFLGREPGWLGPVYRDANVVDAVRRQRAVMELHPGTRAARCYERIAMRLVSSPTPRAEASDYWERVLLAENAESLH